MAKWRCRLRRRKSIGRGSGGRDLTAWSYRDAAPRKDGERQTREGTRHKGWGRKKGKRSSNEIMKAKW